MPVIPDNPGTTADAPSHTAHPEPRTDSRIIPGKALTRPSMTG